MRAAEHAPRGPLHLLERRHGLAEIVERGAGVQVERRRVIPPQSERESMTLSETLRERVAPRALPCTGATWLLRSDLAAKGSPRSC